MAATSSYGQVLFLGGSSVSYNYNGIAYNGSGVVPPNGRSLWYNPENSHWQEETGYAFPMDLRGIAKLSDTSFYLVGGMQAGPQVSDQCLRLRLNPSPILALQSEQAPQAPLLFPNPSIDGIFFLEIPQNTQYRIFDALGICIKTGQLEVGQNQLNLQDCPAGHYYLLLKGSQNYQTIQLLKGN